MDWISLLQTLGGIVGGFGIGVFTKSGRKRDRADADLKVQEAQSKMIDNYEERIKDLHTVIDKYNENEKKHAVRLSEKEQIIEDKTQRIRELTGKVWNSEQEVNKVNAQLDEANRRIIKLTEERDEERRKKEYYRNWRCEKSVCHDPDGRRPPNARLSTEKYRSPE